MRHRQRGFTLTEVLVALAVAVLFLTVSSALEVNSIRALDQLHRRELALLLARSTLNQVRASSEHNVPPQSSNTTVSQEGIDFKLSIQVEPLAQTSEMTINGSKIDRADLLGRSYRVVVTAQWPGAYVRTPLQIKFVDVITCSAFGTPSQ